LAYNLRWYIEHYIKKTNYIRTNLSIGYYDKPVLIEDGLFSLVEDFISKDGEDAFRYGEEEDIREIIIDILHFYRVRKPEVEKEQEELLHELYGDTTWEFIEKDKRKVMTRKHSNKYTEKERDEMFNKHTELEEELEKETTEMLKKCIEIRHYLWT